MKTDEPNPLQLTDDFLSGMLTLIGSAEQMLAEPIGNNDLFDRLTTVRDSLNKIKIDVDTRRTEANRPFLGEQRRINQLADVLFDLVKPVILRLDASRKAFQKLAAQPIELPHDMIPAGSLDGMVRAALNGTAAVVTQAHEPVVIKSRSMQVLDIFDVTLIPQQYLVVDTALVKAALLAGTHVPGARFIQKEILL